jgi:hypothetical protein
MFVAGGIVSLKPIGGLITNNPSMTVAQAEEAKKIADRRATQRQQKVDQFINKVADANKDANNKPKWTVPFK